MKSLYFYFQLSMLLNSIWLLELVLVRLKSKSLVITAVI